MTEQDDFDPQWSARARSHHPPPDTPRDEMWAAIQAARSSRPARPEPGVIALPVRAPRHVRPAVWWVTGIAAATILGAVLGRVTAPDRAADTVARGATPPETSVVANATPGLPQPTPTVEDVRPVTPSPSAPRRQGRAVGTGRTPEAARDIERPGRETNRAYRVAAAEHLAVTEALLVTLRADLHAGRQDSTIGKWATSLLGTTRLMMDSPASQDPQLRRLLEDLELVLAQIARLQTTNADTTELRIIDDAMRRRQVLTRLRAMAPGA